MRAGSLVAHAIHYFSILLAVVFFVTFTGRPTNAATDTAVEAIPSSRDEKIEIHVSEGQTIDAVLRIPSGCPKGSRFPVILIFGGFEEAGRVLELIHPQEPVILASFDYPYAGNRKFTFPTVLLEARKIKQALEITEQAISRLVPLLKDRNDVDPRHLAIVGASFGAPFAIHATAVNPDLNTLIIVHGFGNVQETIKHRLSQIWSNRLGLLAGPAAWIASEVIVGYLNPPKPEKDVGQLKASQNVLMIEAQEDIFIPQASREILWTALSNSPAQVKRIQMPGGHLQPGAGALIEKIMNLTVDWMKKMGWFAATLSCK